MSMLIIIKYMYIDNYQHAHIIFKLLKLIAWHLNFIYKSRNKENIFDKLKAQLPNNLLSVNVIGLHLTTQFTKTITVSFDCHFIYIFSFDIKIHLTIFFLQNVELKKTRDVSEVIFFSLMILISQILIHYICMYNGQRHQKEQKIKLQTPFKKSLILGMKNDVEKKITQILHYFSLFSPIIIIFNLQSWKKSSLIFVKFIYI